MRGEFFRPAWLNERIKKLNSEHGDKPRKPITFLPPPPMESTSTTSDPKDKSASLSSLESCVTNLKAELEVEAKDITEDEGYLDLQKLLVKDKDKEDVFTEKIDEGSMDRACHMMPSCRYNCTDAMSANDEERFPVSIKKDDCLRPTSCHQDSLDPSA